MIDKLRVRNFRCLRDVEVRLGPLNFLIGPNNTGKSSFVKAVETLCATTRVPNVNEVFLGHKETKRAWDGRGHELSRILTDGISEPILDYECHASWIAGEGDKRSAIYKLAIAKQGPDSPPNVGFAVPQEEDIVIRGPHPSRQVCYTKPLGAHEATILQEGQAPAKRPLQPHETILCPRLQDPELQDLRRCLSSTPVYQLVPRQIALPCAGWPGDLVEANGHGLAAYLSRYREENPSRFSQIIEILGKLVPGLENITFPNVSKEEKTILFHEKRGVGVYASEASDGLLLFLAYLAIAYAHRDVGVVLIEEPETGVHPRRLNDIVRILRAMSRGELGLPPVQVIATSHSPYLLDWCGKEEVIFFYRDEQGEVRVKPVAEVPEIDERIEDFESLGAFIYSAGEAACKSPS